MTRKKQVQMMGSIVPAEGWLGLFFEADEDGYADEDTVSTSRVACWAVLGGRVVGLVATSEGLVPAEDDELFRGYVDGTVKGSAQLAVDAWDADVEAEIEAEKPDQG